MENNLSIQFQAYQGFHGLISPQTEGLEYALKSIYARSIQGPGGFHVQDRRGVRTHNSIKMLDIFISVPKIILSKMCADQASIGFSSKLLVINPYSRIALSRAEALHAIRPSRWSRDPVFETNKYLFEVLEALHQNSGKNGMMDGPRVDEDQDKYLEILSESIEKIGHGMDFQLRFYDRITESPVYIFSEFLVKGLILDQSAASNNPWLIFVDDRTQGDDIFDRLSHNFDDIWEYNAVRYPRLNSIAKSRRLLEFKSKKRETWGSVFISMRLDPGNLALLAVKSVIKDVTIKYGLTANTVEEVNAFNNISNEIVSAIEQSDLVICDLSYERPNVYYEAGFAQARNKPVIFIVDKDSELHFDVSGFPVTKYSGIAELKQLLDERMEEIFFTSK